MECRKCGNEISGDEYRMVAEWPFCLTCFERLLSKPAEPPPAAEAAASEPPVESAVAPPGEADSTATPETLRCLLCEKEITDGRCERLASWVFCPTCFGTLVSLPDEEDEPAAPRSKKSPLVPPTYAAHKSCKGCGRRIPERAAKEIDGEPYCPDCYTAKARSVTVVPEIRATVNVTGGVARPRASSSRSQDKGRAAPREAGKGCESYGRDVAEAALQTVEGFAICQACLSTDADMALHLARKRHHLYLERLKTELD